jgi:pimeloyl-ACP methyl ester carboxylesterase
VIAVAAVCTLLAPATASARDRFTERSVERGTYRIHVRDYPGKGPALVLMHGFPDDLHLYDRVFPYLRGRRVVAFDFLGWGQSDKPSPDRWAYTFDAQKKDLEAVVSALKLDKPVLVAHDASGPAAVNFALDGPSRVGGLVLLNTFYGITPTILPPEAVAIFGDLTDLRRTPDGPDSPWTFSRLGDAIASNPRIARWLYYWQVGGFIRDRAVRRELLPKLWASFRTSIRSFRALDMDLLNTLLADTARAPELATLGKPVRIVFGDEDPYLNAGVARTLHTQIPGSELFLVKGAHHYVQVDEPRRVARLLLTFRP